MAFRVVLIGAEIDRLYNQMGISNWIWVTLGRGMNWRQFLKGLTTEDCLPTALPANMTTDLSPKGREGALSSTSHRIEERHQLRKQ